MKESTVLSEVTVVGGGIVGVSTALELARAGLTVTLIEKGQLGHGCSYGNAGWMTPCFALPLPIPGMFWKSLGWLLDPDSPLRIQPRLSLSLATWLMHFLKSTNTQHLFKSVEVLTAISRESLRQYSELAGENPARIGFERKGLLMVGQTSGGVHAAVQELEWVGRFGINGRLMGVDEIRAFEPALTGALSGGVYFPDEAHGEPLAIVRALAEEAQKLGVQILDHTEVFEISGAIGLAGRETVTSLKTTRGELAVKNLVLATGAWSKTWGERLGMNVPVLGGKGYALITDTLEKQPKTPLMLVEKKIAVTPREGSLRLAGTLELVDQDDSINVRRVNAIVKGAREFLTLPREPKIKEVWRGLRPCTSDGVPMIGRAAKFSNLYLNLGHQMLGLQSAPGSARLLREILLGQSTYVDAKPFRPERF